MLTRRVPMTRTGFNRRAAAAAKLRNSALVEPYAMLQRLLDVIQPETPWGNQRLRTPPPTVRGRFGEYRVAVEQIHYGYCTRLLVHAPDGRRISAEVPRC